MADNILGKLLLLLATPRPCIQSGFDTSCRSAHGFAQSGVFSQEVPVSEDCLDMLRRVLVANPSQRLNMDQIRAHRWFRGSLPPGALEMNRFLINGFGPMDEVCTPSESFLGSSLWDSRTDQ